MKRKQSRSYYTRDLRVLYKIADEGILHLFLHGVNIDRTDPSRRVWYFARVPEIKAIIDQYADGEEITA